VLISVGRLCDLLAMKVADWRASPGMPGMARCGSRVI
jgi:hypothetical protein